MQNTSKKTIWFMLTIAILTTIVILSATRKSEAIELPFVENGALYESNALDPGDEGRILATEVTKILDYNRSASKILYIGKKRGVPGTEDVRNEIWLLDKVVGSKILIHNKAVNAYLSPNSELVAVWNSDHEIVIYNAKGEFIQKAGVHGAAAAFSPDNRYIAYEKLADTSFDGNTQSLFEFAQGIAVYDLSTGKETLLTKTVYGEDFAAIGFSANNRKVYFKSGREGKPGIWSVNIDGTDLKQLTSADIVNPNFAPFISEHPLWSTDRRIAISDLGRNEKEIWIFKFDSSGDIESAKLLTGGESPQWLVQDKTITVRITHNGKRIWRTINIQ